MPTQNTNVIFIEPDTVTVVNSTALSTLYQATIDGGSLEQLNRLRWDMQGRISFNSTNFCTLYQYYAGLTVSSCILGAVSGSSTTGLRIIVELSGDNSVTSQFGTIHAYVGLQNSNDASVPLGSGTVGAASGADQIFAIKAKWNVANGNNSISHNHSTLELLSFVEEEPLPALDEPTAIIYLNSKLNNLRYNLRKDVYFYAELVYDLVHAGYGEASFTRVATSTAMWRDGASHTIAANQGRFEYSGETPLGLAMNTATETLTFASANSLHNSNTLCWLENNIYKSTKRGDTVPFNPSGVWIGNTGIHISQIVKFNRVITLSEDSETEQALT